MRGEVIACVSNYRWKWIGYHQIVYHQIVDPHHTEPHLSQYIALPVDVSSCIGGLAFSISEIRLDATYPGPLKWLKETTTYKIWRSRQRPMSPSHPPRKSQALKPPTSKLRSLCHHPPRSSEVSAITHLQSLKLWSCHRPPRRLCHRPPRKSEACHRPPQKKKNGPFKDHHTLMISLIWSHHLIDTNCIFWY